MQMEPSGTAQRSSALDVKSDNPTALQPDSPHDHKLDCEVRSMETNVRSMEAQKQVFYVFDTENVLEGIFNTHVTERNKNKFLSYLDVLKRNFDYEESKQ